MKSPRSAAVLKEKHLYPALVRHMTTKGFSEVVGAASDRKLVLPVVLQEVDALGCRWTDDNDVDAWAVEVKRGVARGDVRAAFAQAVAYSAVVPRVSIGTPAGRLDLEEIRPHMKRLGLGHVSISPSGTSDGEPPDQAVLFQRELFFQTTRHAAVLLLLARERFGADADLRPHAGVWQDVHEAPSDPPCIPGSWGFAVHTMLPVQWMFWIRRGPGEIIASLWIENRPHHAHLPDSEGALRRAIPVRDDLILGVWPRRYRQGGVRPPASKCRSGCSPDDLPALMRYVRAVLDEKGVSPRFSIGLRLWTTDQRPTRSEADARLRSAMEALSPVRQILEDAVGDCA
ncbi:MAG: hypothetical protein HY905_03815 [Deltaproteobacteria bacterium]|nr:hypothetical protein [Deltaproteobacteria bacterium]